MNFDWPCIYNCVIWLCSVNKLLWARSSIVHAYVGPKTKMAASINVLLADKVHKQEPQCLLADKVHKQEPHFWLCFTHSQKWHDRYHIIFIATYVSNMSDDCTAIYIVVLVCAFGQPVNFWCELCYPTIPAAPLLVDSFTVYLLTFYNSIMHELWFF